MAMAEASKLFDKSGGASSGNKQDAVNGAAMTVMKLLVQSKFGGAQTIGGSNSGGLSGLLSLVSCLGGDCVMRLTMEIRLPSLPSKGRISEVIQCNL